jgi:hypothetical protein
MVFRAPPGKADEQHDGAFCLPGRQFAPSGERLDVRVKSQAILTPDVAKSWPIKVTAAFSITNANPIFHFRAMVAR